MACYERFRGLCTVWCSLEILFFSGIIYGWSSLVFIFINEGFYADLCEVPRQIVASVESNNDSTYVENVSIDYYSVTSQLPVGRILNCADQETRLGLWFSIGVGFTWAGMAIFGPLSKALGTRVTRIIILLVYEAGLLCLAFTTVEIPWLICPGLCCIGVAGLAHFASNIQVANLFTIASSTIVALFCGLFDSSSIVFQIVKIAYGNGIGRKESMLFLACLHLLMIGTSTFFILPKCYISGPKKAQDIQICVVDGKDYQLTNMQHESTIMDQKPNTKIRTKQSIRWYMTSITYIMHVIWMTILCLLFATFLNILHIRVDKLAKGEKHVASYYLGVFAYTTMGSLIGSVIAGLIYDFERKRYRDCSYPENKWRPVVIPMIACTVFIIAVFSCILAGTVTFLLPSFILFTLFRNFLYSIGIAFVNEAFPTEYFGHLYGIMASINGLFSLLQYGFVKWTVSSPEDHQQVPIVLIVLGVLTFLHPIQLWVRSKRNSDTGKRDVEKVTQTELLPVEN